MSCGGNPGPVLYFIVNGHFLIWEVVEDEAIKIANEYTCLYPAL